MSGGLSGKAAIAGIGQTEFSKESGRSEMQLACEAVSAALKDAGLPKAFWGRAALDFLIADSFTRALARLTAQDQKAAKTTASSPPA